jgi:large subunit ribosomal protein L9
MKVIFLEDMPKVAKAGDIKEVADGYGRNYLIPRKLAVPATPAAVSSWKIQLEKGVHTQAQTEAELQELAGKLDGKEVVLSALTGGKERLYGSVTAADIAAELERTAGFVIDKRKIELPESIRQVGSYEVVVRLGKDITPKIKVTVAEKEAG